MGGALGADGEAVTSSFGFFGPMLIVVNEVQRKMRVARGSNQACTQPANSVSGMRRFHGHAQCVTQQCADGPPCTIVTVAYTAQRDVIQDVPTESYTIINSSADDVQAQCSETPTKSSITNITETRKTSLMKRIWSKR